VLQATNGRLLLGTGTSSAFLTMATNGALTAPSSLTAQGNIVVSRDTNSGFVYLLTNGTERFSLTYASSNAAYSQLASVGDTVLRATVGKLLLGTGVNSNFMVIDTDGTTTFNMGGLERLRVTAGSVGTRDTLRVGWSQTGDRWTGILFHSHGTPLQSSGTTQLAQDPGANGDFYFQKTGGTGAWIFYNSAWATQLIIRHSGNVGIGTSVEYGRLNVAGGAIALNGGLTNNAARPALSATPGAYEIRGYSSAGLNFDDGFLRLTAGGGTTTTQQSTIELSGYSNVADMDRNIVFRTLGVERMRIDSGGTVRTDGDLELGVLGTGDRDTFIDFHASGTPGANDFSARFQRSQGANGYFDQYNLGTNGFAWYTSGSLRAILEGSANNGVMDIRNGMVVSGDGVKWSGAGGMELRHWSGVESYIISYNRVATTWLPLVQFGSLLYFSIAGNTRATLTDTAFVPAGTVTLGTSGARWWNAFLSNGPDVSSDRNLKKEILDAALGLEFIRLLRPVSYVLKDTYYMENTTKLIGNDTTYEITNVTVRHDRRHYGLIAQEVKDALDRLNVSTMDFAAYSDPSFSNQTGTLSLKYEEFISPLMRAVQELDNRTIPVSGAPESRTSPCEPGQQRFTETHLYTCIAPNSWGRTVFDVDW
jgi:hypothetical protein